MSDQSPVSRRSVLTAVSTAAVVGLVTRASDAGDKSPDSNHQSPLKLQVTLTDGQVLTLNAAEVVIDFGGNGKLCAKPSGILPIGAATDPWRNNDTERPSEGPRK
jgi:hypothetical protein